eukprot:scaffold50453_cov18-Tisochrysis_lutea.AAC.1
MQQPRFSAVLLACSAGDTRFGSRYEGQPAACAAVERAKGEASTGQSQHAQGGLPEEATEQGNGKGRACCKGKRKTCCWQASTSMKVGPAAKGEGKAAAGKHPPH